MSRSASPVTWLILGFCAVLLVLLLAGNQSPSPLCSFTKEELGTLIWSHRAHADGVEVDGSAMALTILLAAGINSFDVDVIARDGQYFVSHPSAFIPNLTLASQLRSLSVEAFLSVVGDHSQRHPQLPKGFITMEPKFTEPQRWQELFEIISKNILYDPSRVALICNEPQQLDILQKLQPPPSTALAFRTVPKTAQDFRWEDGLAPPVFPTFHKDQTVVLMPDVKLIHRPVRRLGHPRHAKVIVWVVDSVDEMTAALEENRVDGIISNRAISLLGQLQKRHQEVCGKATLRAMD